MKIEFHPLYIRPFVRDVPTPWPTILRLPKVKGGTYASSIEADQWPPVDNFKDDYIEFELGTIKYQDNPDSNVINMPRKAYKERRK